VVVVVFDPGKGLKVNHPEIRVSRKGHFPENK
jgi:hypothetical protein